MKDTQFIKIHGVSEKGFFLRLVETKPYQKILSEVFVRTTHFAFDNANISNAGYSNKARIQLNTLKAKHLDEYFQTLRKNASKKWQPTFRGSLMVWKHNEKDKPIDFPLIDIPVFVEHTIGAEIECTVTKDIYEVQNKIFAISALFESIIADLDNISQDHFDDNGKELAGAVKDKFQKLFDDFEEKVNETSGDWMQESLSGVLYRLIRDHHQTLVIPEFRRMYFEKIAQFDNNLTNGQKEAELEEWLASVRKQFNLSEKWR